MKLTEKAVDAIEYMGDSAREVLCFLAEQEDHGYDDDPYFYFLSRLSDFFHVCADNEEICYVTDTGEILTEVDIDNFYYSCNLQKLVPITTGKFIEEAFFSEIRSMLISLKEIYQTRKK